jgi:glycosyltransferase involved in cell wall biosynthesis
MPTHNRAALLRSSLEALAQQSVPASSFELIVVADACQDDTVALVQDWTMRAPYRLALLAHTAQNAAATRNLGAAHAQGDFLLFLDDDVVAEPDLVRHHWEARADDRVNLGYSKPTLPFPPSLWQLSARLWWEDRFRELGQPGHRFSFRDFFSGNVSLPSAMFRRVGGFDSSITGRLEDYELGIRLLKDGASFAFLAGAIGHHHETSDLEQWLQRLQQEGKADIAMGQRHPELRAFLFDPRKLASRPLGRLAFNHPHRGDRLNRLLVRQARLCERCKLRGLWFPLLGWLRDYNYWRGVAAAIGPFDTFEAWLQEVPFPPAIAPDAPVLDLAAPGLEATVAAVLDHGSRFGLRVVIDGIEVLAIPPKPGWEPLRLQHVQACLRELAESQFVPALALKWLRARGPDFLCQPDLPKLI